MNPADTTAKAFLWSLATLEAVDLSPIYASVGLDSAAATASVRAMCVAVYTRLSAGGNDLNYKHRLAMLTGWSQRVINKRLHTYDFIFYIFICTNETKESIARRRMGGICGTFTTTSRRPSRRSWCGISGTAGPGSCTAS